MSTLIKLLKIVKKLIKQRREAANKLQQLEAFLEANGWERITPPKGFEVRSKPEPDAVRAGFPDNLVKYLADQRLENREMIMKHKHSQAMAEGNGLFVQCPYCKHKSLIDPALKTAR